MVLLPAPLPSPPPSPTPLGPKDEDDAARSVPGGRADQPAVDDVAGRGREPAPDDARRAWLRRRQG